MRATHTDLLPETNTHGTEIDSFLSVIQEQYSEALQTDDEQDMAETSGTLAISYAAMGRHDLARRWANEFLDFYFRRMEQQHADQAAG